MRIFTDSHHSGLYRSLFLLFHERLGHDLYFPDASWCQKVGKGVWLPIAPDRFQTLEGVDERWYQDFPFIVSEEEFLRQDWDVVISTRLESDAHMQRLIRIHPNKNIKAIVQTGNEFTNCTWTDNFLSSDKPSYERSTAKNKLLYSQELGQQYCQPFVPLTKESLQRVNCFVNCFPTFPAYKQWNELKQAMPEIEFRSYGIDCTHGFQEERDLPAAINNAALTLWGKGYEGYGHSILQSISMGRPVIVPKGFFDGRTAGKYMIPGKTCFEVNNWNLTDLRITIECFASNLYRANEVAYECWSEARRLMDWQEEANKVKLFLERL